MDEKQLEALVGATLFQYQQSKLAQINAEARSFVHYTTTEAALSIISNQEIWLRNSSVMNDYSEIKHGEDCLRFCLVEDDHARERAKSAFNAIGDGLYDKIVHGFFEAAPLRRAFTYLLSISEHGPLIVKPGVIDEESLFGRLSMWRAYGQGGVALIFKKEPIVETVSEGIDAYSSPVFYGNPDAFAQLFHNMLAAIELNIDQIKKFDTEVFATNVANALHFASLSTKHPGFSEEREWRITYSANPLVEPQSDDEFNQTSAIKREFRSINGLPQRIYKIPFRNDPAFNISGITLPSILKHIVIGPTQYPTVVYDSLVMAMRRAGFADKDISISISNIPIRT
mgnify:CR=1 FL=1